MKKFTCLLLAISLAISLAGCQSGSQTGEATAQSAAAAQPATVPETIAPATIPATEPATVPTTEPDYWTVEEAFAFSAEASLAENSKTVTYKTAKEYEKTLHKLGFKEYRGDKYRITLNSPVLCKPTKLTYNDKVFRLDFDYMDYEDPSDSLNLIAPLKTLTGWSLYGVKDAPGIANVSDYHREDFQESASWDMTYNSAIFRMAEFIFYNLGEDIPSCMITNTVYYYHGSDNLYNLVKEQEDPANVTTFPDILCVVKGDFNNPGYGFAALLPLPADLKGKIGKNTTSLYELKLQFDEVTPEVIYEFHMDGLHHTYYEGDMTIRDWYSSKFAHNHDWTFSADKSILFYTPAQWNADKYGLYGITDLDRKIKDAVIYPEEGGPAHLVLLPYEKLGLTAEKPNK